MSGDASVEAAVARAVTELVTPLRTALSTPETLRSLLGRFGWNADLLDPAGVDRVRAAFGLTDALAELADLATKLESADTADSGALAQLAAQAVTAFGRLADGVRALQSLSAQGLPFPLNQPGFLAELAVDVLDDALLTWLEDNHPTTTAVLTLLGLVTVEAVTPADANRSPYLARRLRWDRLAAVADPVTLTRQRFRWGDPAGFDHAAALSVLARVAWYLEAPALLREPDRVLLDRHYTADSPARPSLRELRVPLLSAGSPGDDDYAEAGLSILPVPAGDGIGTVPGGLLASAYLQGTLTSADDGDPVTVTITGQLADDASFAVRFDAAGVTVTADAEATALDAAVAVTGTPEQPWLLAGVRGGTRVELSQLRAAIEVHGTIAAPELVVSISTGPLPPPPGLSFVLQLGDDDGFLAKLFGTQPHQVQLGGELRWSSSHGLSLSGAPGLETEIAVRAAAAGVSLDSVTVRVQPRDGGLRVGLGLNGSAALGPFAVSVSGVGLALDAAPAATPGQRVLGDLALRFGVQPPTGVGLAIATPVVSGGGFLALDPDTGLYAGVFELTLLGTVSVKAVGLINTKDAQGRPSFALLIIITAEGFTPIQLGFGFELTGIGGLLALNHTVNADAVKDGLRDGVLDQVLFVSDPIHNAAKIITTLERVFPQSPDRLLIGPLVEIGWGGSPPLVKIRMALLLELPKPVRVVLLAALSAYLPKPGAAVVELHVDAIGVLDLSRGELSLDASLHDSRILTYPLAGDMALLCNWGDAPIFVLSCGGFHPRYQAPSRLRQLNRLSLTLASGVPSVRLEAYLAITSNSIQFGARLTLSASIAGFGVNGGGAFDALVQWSPFFIDLDLQAWVKITAGGETLFSASINAELSGPTPWHVTGTASISLLFWSVDVHIDFTFGDSVAPPPADTVDVAGLIFAELETPSSWQASLPAGLTPGATLAAPAAAAGAPFVVHPRAQLSVRQKAAPLDTPISRVGARLPAAGTRSYTLAVTAPAGYTTSAVTDKFAPAQYSDLSDDAKLSGAAFADFHAGVTIAPQNPSAVPTAGLADTDLMYETLDLTSLDEPPVAGQPVAAQAASALPRRGPLSASTPGLARSQLVRA